MGLQDAERGQMGITTVLVDFVI